MAKKRPPTLHERSTLLVALQEAAIARKKLARDCTVPALSESMFQTAKEMEELNDAIEAGEVTLGEQS